jgi:hypothetical protein
MLLHDGRDLQKKPNLRLVNHSSSPCLCIKLNNTISSVCLLKDLVPVEVLGDDFILHIIISQQKLFYVCHAEQLSSFY